MAGAKIRGITIELGADASGVTKALKGIDSQLKTTQSNLKDINRLLKLDPTNTELLTQKQKNLKTAIGLTKDRIEELKKAQSKVKEGTAEWDALEREIIDNEQKLKSLKKEYSNFGSVAAQKIKAVGTAMQDAGKKIEDVGKKLAPLSGAAAAIGGGLIKLGYNAVTSADELKTLSQQTGFTTDELQKMQYASELVDVSVEDMTGALRKFKTKIDPANESLKNLGVAVIDGSGNLRDANDVFFDAVIALGNIQNETERDQAAMELFGKSADELAGIIDDGGKSFRAYGKQAEELGLILDGDTIDSLNDTNDTISELKANIGGTMAQIGTKVATVLLPVLDKISDVVSKITDRLRQLTPEQTETILKIVGIVAVVAPLVIVIGKIVSGIGTLLTVIPMLLSPVGLVIAAIAAAVAIGVVLVKNWDKIKAGAKKLWQNLKQSWQSIKDDAVTTWNNVKTAISNVWDNIKTKVSNTVTAVKTFVVNSWTNIKTSISTTLTNIKATVSSKWSEIKSTISTTIANIKQTVSDKFSEVVNKIKEIFRFDFKLPELKLPTWEDIKRKLEELINKIKNLFNFNLPINIAGATHHDRGRDVMTAPTMTAGATAVTVNVYAAQGQSAQEIASEVQRILVNQQKQRSRAYA